jgi:hypothetical protein
LFELFNGWTSFPASRAVGIEVHATNIADLIDSAITWGAFLGGIQTTAETIVEAFCTRWVSKEIQHR